MKNYIPATQSDVGTILQLMRRYYAEDGYEFREDQSHNALLQLIGNENLGRVWVLRKIKVRWLDISLSRSVSVLSTAVGMHLPFNQLAKPTAIMIKKLRICRQIDMI